MEIKTGTFNFPPGTGERTARLSFVFTHPLTEAHVALCGYRAEFIKADRQIQRLVVRLSTEIGGRVDDGWVATVVARFNLRDENEEHPFSGAIDFVLFAEVQDFAPEPAFALVPERRDLETPMPEAVESEVADPVKTDEQDEPDKADLEIEDDPASNSAEDEDTGQEEGPEVQPAEEAEPESPPADDQAAESDAKVDPDSEEALSDEVEEVESPATEAEE
jgi:hypothetical protein